ncbi:beta strand repeat-containing protein [Aerosakkonemataceae cyanobacterium BLCC-F50]|uniref:Beta strand repeat-containing protein n=1 Tax=Floridaenema flaviceps BLCC-F50 TaxID=3153642 RepID=A0ABV4XS99_9CYAN
MAIISGTITTGNDIIIADAADDVIDVLAGNDSVRGGGGNDSLFGGDGNDTLIGEAGNDTLNGGSGLDRVEESGDFNFILSDNSLIGNGTDSLVSIETAQLTGGAGNNLINASGFTLGSVILSGGAGNDTLLGGTRNDTMTGGAGNDIFNGGAGNNDRVEESGNVNFTLTDTTLIGNGTDSLTGIESVFLTGGAGNNALNALAFTLGTVNLNGGAGNDTLLGGTRDDTMTGGLGDDLLNGGDGFDRVVEAGDINFTLSGFTLIGNGTDNLSSIEQVQLTGGAGNNLINAAGFTVGGVRINGLDGNDTLIGGSQGDLINGGKGNDSIDGGDGADSINDFDGGNDTINSGAGNDEVQSGNGSDLINGGDGIDALFGGSNDDTINGEGGNDGLNGDDGNDLLLGGDGDDFMRGGLGNDTINGGAGSDEVFVSLNQDLNLTLTNNSLTGEGVDTLISIERANLGGSTGPNALNASAFTGSVQLSGNGGRDSLTGGSGNDTLNGFDSEEVDILSGGAGNDFYTVDGRDIVIENAGAGVDTVEFNPGIDGTIFSFILPANVENLELIIPLFQNASGATGIGNNLNNLITGSNRNDLINGLSGSDTLLGGNGNDNLIGDSGNDNLNGGDGDDILNGGAGNDVLIDGGGADRFLFSTGRAFNTADVGIDTINDLSLNDAQTAFVDRILLSKTTFTALETPVGSNLNASDFEEIFGSDSQAALSAAEIVYNADTGSLFYNPNGSASGFGTGGQFATVTNSPFLFADDVIISVVA